MNKKLRISLKVPSLFDLKSDHKTCSDSPIHICPCHCSTSSFLFLTSLPPVNLTPFLPCIMSSPTHAFLPAVPFRLRSSPSILAPQSSSYCPSYSPRQQPSIPQKQTQSPRCEISLTTTILRALDNEFPDQDISRVSQSFRDVIAGVTLEHDINTPRHQRAASFIQGLEAHPFYDDFDTLFPWVNHLEANWTVIRDELIRVTGLQNLAQIGNNIWAPPVVEAANAYGPDWRTLVLQDRDWDPVNSKLFPETTRLLRDANLHIPSVEAFFARQSPDTGIKLHTDDCNFILTVHLALSVPPEQSWIEVAGERRYWENGKALVFNTSFFHRTMNESKHQERHVLLIRFWHPQLTQTERDALNFLFQVIDNPDGHPAVLKATRQLRTESVRSKGKNKADLHSNHRSTGGRGFAR